MSADNGIYILQTKDGWRLTHTQAIENLFWHLVPGGDLNQYEQKDIINMSYLYSCFKNSKVYEDKNQVWHQAMILYREIGYVEYGIKVLPGLENIEFPSQCCSNPNIDNIIENDDSYNRCLNCGEFQ